MNTTNNKMNKPRIALTPRLVHDQNINQSVISSYADAIIKNGGLAYLLTIDLDNIAEIVNDFDGLVVTGGVDVTPSLYHEDAIANEENLLAFYKGSSLDIDTKFKSYIYSYEEDQRNCELEILVRNS